MNVAKQAALSLCGQFLDHSEEAPFDPSLLPRLRELCDDEKDEVAQVIVCYDVTDGTI